MKLKHIKTRNIEYHIDNQKRKQGKYIEYYGDGEVAVICNYKDDCCNGEYTLWYSSGQICCQCYYKDGKYHGKYRWWDKQGKIIQKIIYDNGELK